MVPKREPFLQEADRVARITLPHLDVLGNGKRRNYTTTDPDLKAISRPYSDAGGQAMSQFASANKALILPPNAAWFKLGIPVEYEALLDQISPDAAPAMDAMLGQGENKVTGKIAEHGVYGECEEGFRRLLAEGQQLCQVTLQGFRMLPLRCFCVKRKNGKVVRVVIKEELGSYEDQEDRLYTLIDYEKGAVWQQSGDAKNAKKVAFSPKQFFVVTTMQPTAGCDYATSFASLYFGTIYTINFLSKKIQEIVHWASVNLLGIDPAIQITPQEFKEKIERGDNVFSWPILPDGRTAQVGFFSAQSKVADLATLTQEMQRHEAILYRAFSLGIIQQSAELAGRERVTAAEIVARTQEIDATAQGHASTLQATFQQPLVEAYLDILGITVQLPNGQQGIKPIILAGANMLSRMVKVNQLLGSVSTIASIPETPWTAGLDRNALFLEVARAQGYENAERFLLPPQPPPEQAGPAGPTPPEPMLNGGMY